MKATLTEHGVLIVRAESSLEAYALRRWSGEASLNANDLLYCEVSFIRGSKILIDTASTVSTVGK